ncbi:MAG: S26 family signal peptidase [Candidatus Porifericomitaceae bacterium WSBS_2022_MAG_OTU9]
MKPFALRRFVWLLLLTVLLTTIAASVCRKWQFLLNLSDSLPQRLYLLHRTATMPQRGQLVAFIAPVNPLYPQGSLFLKQVVGMPGDVVGISEDADGHHYWMVSGRKLGLLQATSSNGIALRPGPVGTIPSGQMAVWTEHANGYDSRYADIGWIDVATVVGVAKPLW